MIKHREEQPAPRTGNIARQYGLAAVQPRRGKTEALEVVEAKTKDKAAKKPAKKAGKRRMAR